MIATEAICMETTIKYVRQYISYHAIILYNSVNILYVIHVRTNKKIIELFCHLVCFK